MKPNTQGSGAQAILTALLQSRQFLVANLYTFTLVGGGVLRYCSGDQDITLAGNTFTAGGATGPYLDTKDNKAAYHWKLGVEVDTLSFDVIPGAATVNGQPFLAACVQGVFDGAELQVERCFMKTYGDTSAGSIILFVGRVAEVILGRTLATFSVNSHLELLNQNLPRNLFQPGCVNVLFDAACALSASAFAVLLTAAAGSTILTLKTASSQPNGYYALGKIVGTSGANNGVARTVQAWTTGSPGTMTLLEPLPNAPAPGDTFTGYPGCNLTQGQCLTKFNNLANFRAEPYIPVPETAV